MMFSMTIPSQEEPNTGFPSKELKFAIANNWATGSLPLNLRDLTFAEIRMATLAPISSVIKVVGRSNAVLKSHTMALLATPKPALMQVRLITIFRLR